jgi:hypothetical protein
VGASVDHGPDGLADRLLDLEQPGEVVGVAGAWLAASLADEGFVWLRSRGTLQRRAGARTEQIHLQSSKWNRTGELVQFGSIVNVRDRDLRKWRRDHPDLTLNNGDDWVCGHPFGTIVGSYFQGEVDLSRADERLARLAGFLEKTRRVALPWFAGTADPARLGEEVCNETLDAHVVPLVEFAVLRGERAQAARLVQRWLGIRATHPAHFDAGRALAHRGEKPWPLSLEALGWTSAVLRLD